MKKKPVLSIIIPAKNEENNLAYVLQRLKKYSKKLPSFEIIIVDGHSKDKTGAIAKAYGCKVFRDHGRGKGEAMRVGSFKAGGGILVFMDADGSHDPKDIPRLLRPIIDKKMDHVSGSRMLAGSDELHKEMSQFVRLLGSAIITLAANYRFDVRFTDYQNGFRAIKKDVFLKLRTCENHTTIEQEMMIKTIRQGFLMTEVPTHEYERRSGRSHITVWKVAWRYVYSAIKYLYF